MEAQPNPYAPPRAPVADHLEGAPVGPCPHVELACRLLWISFGISLLNNLVRIVFAPSGARMAVLIIGTLFGAGIGYLILSWATRKLRAGRNWMRWLYTILNVLSWLLIAALWSVYHAVYSQMPISGFVILTTSVSTLISVAVVVLLFTRRSREWFAAHASAR